MQLTPLAYLRNVARNTRGSESPCSPMARVQLSLAIYCPGVLTGLHTVWYTVLCDTQYTTTSIETPPDKETRMTLGIRSGLETADLLAQERTGLVRVACSVDTSLFGGWGVRI